jgi:hypothetical protein
MTSPRFRGARPRLGQSLETVARSGAELEVRIHSPPAESLLRTSIFEAASQRPRAYRTNFDRSPASSQRRPNINQAATRLGGTLLSMSATVPVVWTASGEE